MGAAPHHAPHSHWPVKGPQLPSECAHVTCLLVVASAALFLFIYLLVADPNMDINIDFKKVDLYELFEVSPEATESQIKKAYRKKALVYHPDKNPDNPKANEIFQKLSKALEVLTDKEARSSYDKILRAKKDREIKNRLLDAKRRKLKDALDAREKTAQEVSILNEEEKLKHEIERIRKAGSRQLEEENVMLRKKLEEQRRNDVSNESQAELNRVKIKRKVKIELTEPLVRREFSRFGPISFVIVSKNGKSAILEYIHNNSLKELAANCPTNFDFEILSTKKESKSKAQANEKHDTNNIQVPAASMPEESHEDYEQFVLQQLLQAQSGK